ncbi:uroporphyrinogen-III C-methyltransferase [Zavarzinella formosa]|uniref:uroporphyrinogen-III C-methyltransferase n=1 Tax=Zavarzinella formosa TaxID=360055 RepID=UPI0002FBA7A8|nr:uroporphyrinogen-III C-methyltransferase [Zavarzinella formosa]
MIAKSTRAKVFLVGAGPGDPGLLTLRAVECLQQADFVLYDYLTSTRILDYAPAHAERLCVDELPGEHPQRWPHIHQRIIEEASKGRCVVHLKGGDPLIFGRGGEEAAGLREAGIPYEIVPGVTAAFAAGAYSEIPLTHRAYASAIAIVTGHEHPGKTSTRIDWAALSKFPGTLAVYMAVGRLGLIARELINQGKPADTSVALVHRASTGEQQILMGTLGTIDDQIRLAGMTSPSLVIIGQVVDLKPAVSWFEARPLLGLRVLVTRPSKQAKTLTRQLELDGAVPYSLPVIEAEAPADWSGVDVAVSQLEAGRFSWIVFTSANGVQFFFQRLKEVGKDARVLGGTKIAVIGPSTAEALAEYHLVADLIPSAGMNSETLAAELAERVRGQRVLLAQAAEARELLRQQLSAVAMVETVEAYRQTPAIIENRDVFDRLRRGEIHVVTLTSPNIAKAFLAACDNTIRGRFQRGQITLVANSLRLKQWLAEQNFPAEVTSDPTNAGLMAKLRELKLRRDVGD